MKTAPSAKRPIPNIAISTKFGAYLVINIEFACACDSLFSHKLTHVQSRVPSSRRVANSERRVATKTRVLFVFLLLLFLKNSYTKMNATMKPPIRHSENRQKLHYKGQYCSQLAKVRLHLCVPRSEQGTSCFPSQIQCVGRGIKTNPACRCTKIPLTSQKAIAKCGFG